MVRVDTGLYTSTILAISVLELQHLSKRLRVSLLHCEPRCISTYWRSFMSAILRGNVVAADVRFGSCIAFVITTESLYCSSGIVPLRSFFSLCSHVSYDIDPLFVCSACPLLHSKTKFILRALVLHPSPQKHTATNYVFAPPLDSPLLPSSPFLFSPLPCLSSRTQRHHPYFQSFPPFSFFLLPSRTLLSSSLPFPSPLTQHHHPYFLPSPTLPSPPAPAPHLAHSTTTSVFSVVFSGMAGCRGCWPTTVGGSSPEDTTLIVTGAVDHRDGVPPSTARTRTWKIWVLA